MNWAPTSTGRCRWEWATPCLDCHGCYDGLYFAIETKRPRQGADTAHRN